MAWPSTLAAHRQLNEGVAAHLGGHHSARVVIASVDFAQVEAMQAAGAGALLLCTNTMHKVVPAITAAVDVELIHVADAAAGAALDAGWTTVGLLGTRFTVEDPTVVLDRLRARGLEVLVPGAGDRAVVHRVIYDELVHDVVRPESAAAYREVIARLEAAGAQAIIAGCTEIELLIGPEDVAGGFLPTTTLQVAAGIDWLLGTSDEDRVRARRRRAVPGVGVWGTPGHPPHRPSDTRASRATTGLRAQVRPTVQR